MWTALTWKIKLGIAAGLLLLLVAIVGSTAYISYQKGLNVSKVEIQKYETASQKLQKELAQAQSNVDVKVVTEYKDRVQYVDRIVYKTQDVIRTSVPQQFYLSKGWVYAYNQSVQGLEVDPTIASNNTPASVSDVEALAGTIAPNNGVCLANKSQLDSLQQWIKETDEARKKLTNSK